MAVARHLDLVLLALALPLFVLADLPLGGYATAAGAWLAQRAIQALLVRRAAGATDPRTTLGLAVGGSIARAWLVALAIFGVGVGNHRAGLAAAVLVIVLYTTYFVVGLMTRPFTRGDGLVP
jgi:hypothetical protein